MEATALSVGKAVLDGALGYAKSFLAEEIALQLGVEGDVVFITDELEMMQSFLMSAHEEQDKHPVLLTWVKQVREVSYNVEDSLMDFSVHTDKRTSCWWCIPCSLWERRNIAKEVKELRVKVEDVSNRNLRYRLIKGAGSKPTTAAEEQASIATATMSGINEVMCTAMVQDQNPKVDLCQLIRDGDKDLRVITVWGESSDDSGMTISAIQDVYQDPNVSASFGFRAWVTLMHPFDPAEFIRSLVRQFYVNFPEELEEAHKRKTVGASVYMKMESMTQTAITDVFDTLVVDKSYLIVIDDLSTIMEWDCIKMYFPNNKKGSRIIVSTRQFKIARVCAEKPFEELKQQLPSYQTLYIFHKKVESTSKSSGLSSAENSAISSSEIQAEEQQAKDAGGDDKASDSGAGKKFDRSKTMTLVDEVLVGRSNKKSELIALVGQPEDNLGLNKVISVWGMGGIGKTTLAQSVYRSPQLGRWKRAWATALRPFNPESLIRKLGIDLLVSSEETTSMKIEKLTVELSDFLKREKCLIVLDDISSVAEWDMVQSCLEHTTRIIVTTREKFIAKHCSKEDKNMCNISRLEKTEPFDLFIKKVSKDGAEKIDLSPHMKEQAGLILEKCDGLPLAISTIGGYLATKPKTVTEWRKTYDHISRELEINPELRTIKKVLVRSYDGLPYHLKSCFLCLSIFPEDHKIGRKSIVGRWVAEGYAREMHGMTAEEVGDNYFEELLDRSMILPGDDEVNIRSGKIDSCRLHDIMRQICIAKAREENLCFTLEDGCNLSSTRDAIRHLAISRKWKRDKDMFKSVLDLSHLRSLTVFGKLRPFFISKKMRFLRVLDLERTEASEDDHIDQMIPELIHLKYLSLGVLVKETIRVVSWLLPPSFASLRKLQFLRGYKGFIFTEGIGKLSALRTLDYVKVKDTLPAFRQLHQLRELGIDGISQTNSKEFWSAIASLNHLRSLSVNGNNFWISDQEVDYCLGRTLSPPRSIESLKLNGKLVTLTEWIHELQNLSKLELCGAELKQDAIQAVGKLPGLVILSMFRSFNGEELIFEQGSFPSLVQLELRNTRDVQIVKFGDGTLPKLELLRIDGSEKLRELRGLRSLPKLKEIQLDLGYCSQEFKDAKKKEFKDTIDY